jgi:hypothetical protein
MLKKCLVAVASFVLFTAAHAEVITFHFQGTVTYGTSLAPVGSQVTGSFSYDAKTSAGVLPLQNYATYSFPPPHAFTLQIGDHTAVSNALYASIWNDFGGNFEDVANVYGQGLVLDGITLPDGMLGITLASGPGNTKVFKSVDLPKSYKMSEFDGWGGNYGFVQSDGSPSGQLLQFKVDSITAIHKQ